MPRSLTDDVRRRVVSHEPVRDTQLGVASQRAAVPQHAPVRPRAAAPPRATVPSRVKAPSHVSAPSLVALLLDRVARARIADAVRGRATVVFVDSVAGIRNHIMAHTPGALVAECRDSAGATTLPYIAEVRAGYPSLPVLLYVVPGRTPSADILTAGQLGVHEIIMHGFDDAGIALRAALDSASRRCAATRVLAALRPVLSVDVLPFFRYCLESAAHEPSVADAAAHLGVHPKTLTYRLRSATLPPPSAVISWCRLFLAAEQLEDPLRSVPRIAMDLNFASSAALRGMLKRYTGLRPCEVRHRGGLDAVLGLFTESLADEASQQRDGRSRRGRGALSEGRGNG